MTHGVIFPNQLITKELRPARHLTDRSKASEEEPAAICKNFSLYNPYSASVREDFKISILASAAISGSNLVS